LVPVQVILDMLGPTHTFLYTKNQICALKIHNTSLSNLFFLAGSLSLWLKLLKEYRAQYQWYPIGSHQISATTFFIHACLSDISLVMYLCKQSKNHLQLKLFSSSTIEKTKGNITLYASKATKINNFLSYHLYKYVSSTLISGLQYLKSSILSSNN
jgi:hypothetical protein